VQDAYSLRCAPQVHGAARDTLAHAASVADAELASAIDNPVLTPDGRVESNGNFHGAPVGYVLDFLAIAVADVASMSERRTDRFLDRARNQGLPPFLADEVGVDSGLMIAQYTAAGIVSELKRLAVPASVDSIPSSAMQEDHVSMGWAAARKLRRAIDGPRACPRDRGHGRRRAACAARPLLPGAATGAVVSLVAGVGAVPGPDRFLAPEIEAITALVGRARSSRARRRRPVSWTESGSGLGRPSVSHAHVPRTWAERSLRNGCLPRAPMTDWTRSAPRADTRTEPDDADAHLVQNRAEVARGIHGALAGVA
jgi:histidine ammonia-lyase